MSPQRWWQPQRLLGTPQMYLLCLYIAFIKLANSPYTNWKKDNYWNQSSSHLNLERKASFTQILITIFRKPNFLFKIKIEKIIENNSIVCQWARKEKENLVKIKLSNFKVGKYHTTNARAKFGVNMKREKSMASTAVLSFQVRAMKPCRSS